MKHVLLIFVGVVALIDSVNGIQILLKTMEKYCFEFPADKDTVFDISY